MRSYVIFTTWLEHSVVAITIQRPMLVGLFVVLEQVYLTPIKRCMGRLVRVGILCLCISVLRMESLIILLSSRVKNISRALHMPVDVLLLSLPPMAVGHFVEMD
jgi:hypothetical protein